MWYRFYGRVAALRFYVILNSILVISGRWEGEHERLCTMEPPFTVGKISASSESQTLDRLIRKPALNLPSYWVSWYGFHVSLVRKSLYYNSPSTDFLSSSHCYKSYNLSVIYHILSTFRAPNIMDFFLGYVSIFFCFSIKSYFVAPYLNHLREAVLMTSSNICFNEA